MFCGNIKKEDVRIVLSYAPLQKRDFGSIKEGNIEHVEENFQDRVESQEQLFNILNVAFKNNDEMNFEEYITVVKKSFTAISRTSFCLNISTI